MALGPTEMVFLVGIAIFLFGAKRIPELARNVGRAKGEFQKGLDQATGLDSMDDMDRGGMTEEVASEQE
ncbi:MAG: twin-arginine translocase TatA/TatE family subunit [Candidatus Thalassarchaeaceae archaeon]|jgi:sec-independent protein translocase protein TatA|nr:twin-arginine translocase TatA/TatE family subunit [Candidatus Thalassarchaeaceae archaeon]MDP6703559.1 twin-arginine translocase TatA/TatE family subunit [Candidatus Thalassarchaeaceae archaeon]MDP7004462.1 twin-arginine translocase TatA/TatE family subunit [Candidatus Thalassarchaeaceae archaeon]